MSAPNLIQINPKALVTLQTQNLHGLSCQCSNPTGQFQFTDSGTVTFANGDTVTVYGYDATRIVVNAGGVLSATGTAFNDVYAYAAQIRVNGGGVR